MVKWRVTIKVAYYEVDWMFDTAEEAAEFAIKAAMGRTEKGEPVSIWLNGVLPEAEEENKDE